MQDREKELLVFAVQLLIDNLYDLWSEELEDIGWPNMDELVQLQSKVKELRYDGC